VSRQIITSNLLSNACRIADVVETEYEVFLKSDPDPFDDRHPGIVKLLS
jgi:hypothetical protein